MTTCNRCGQETERPQLVTVGGAGELDVRGFTPDAEAYRTRLCPPCVEALRGALGRWMHAVVEGKRR